MSLLHDPDYITHALRLTYLRHVEDPYGNRVVTFSPLHSGNTYIRAAGFSDAEAWPQLNQPESPKPVESQLAPPASPSRQDPLNGRLQDNEDLVVAPEAGIYPGANLKYTDTIMGPSRSGLAGMRVSGRRHSGQARGTPMRSSSSLSESQSRYRSDSAPTPVPGSANPQTLGSQLLADPALVPVIAPGSDEERAQKRNSGGSNFRTAPISTPPDFAVSNGSTPTATVSVPSRLAPDTAAASPGQAPQPSPIVTLPIFARAAEMEERRRLRMRARFAPSPTSTPVGAEPISASQTSKSNAPAPRRPADTLSLSGTIDSRTSREEDGSGTIDGEGEVTGVLEDSDEDDTDEDADADADADADDMDAEMTESGDPDDLSLLYNPTFTTTNVNPSGSSDENSFLSGNSNNSLSQYHLQSFAPPLPRARSRLSPVTEIAASENPSASARHTPQSVRIPMPRPLSIHSPPAPPTPRASGTRSRAYSSAAGFRVPSPEEPPMAFTRLPVLPRDANSAKSALTEALAARSTISNNPFSELYGAISGRAEQGAIPFRLWFPHANKVKDKDRRGRTIEKPFSLEVKVRKDALAEELIGFGLWAYWESGHEPRLDEGLQGLTQAERDARLSASGWNLRMWEDGEVDTDFPAIARTQTMSQIKTFEELAIVEATPEQVQQNIAAEASIARRPSRMMVTKPRQDSNTTGGLAPPGATTGQAGPVPMMSSSDVVTSNLLTGASIGGTTSIMPGGPAIFLKIKVAAKADVHYSTTINVTADTYIADVLEQVCRKRRLQDSKEWALMTETPSILIPLDRTVASLTGTKELLLHPSSNRSRTPIPVEGLARRWIIEKHTRRKYTVHRKIPMLVGRHERIIAIDGDYVHIMPSNNRAFLDTMKTSSYHIKTVITCKKTKKAPTSIKLVVLRDGGSKRYDFEAEDEKQAGEWAPSYPTAALDDAVVSAPEKCDPSSRPWCRGLHGALPATIILRIDPAPPPPWNIPVPPRGHSKMSQIPSKKVTRTAPALSPDVPYLAQSRATHVSPKLTQFHHDVPHAPSSSTTTPSTVTSSPFSSIETVPTNATRFLSFPSPPKPSPSSSKFLRRTGHPEAPHPDHAPLQHGSVPQSRHRQSDPEQASATVQSRLVHGSTDSSLVCQMITSENVAVLDRPQFVGLPQPRGYRNSSPRSSTGRVLWGREGLPVRSYDTRQVPPCQPVPVPNVLPGLYQRPPSNAPQHISPMAPGSLHAHQSIPDTHMRPGVAQASSLPSDCDRAHQIVSSGLIPVGPNPITPSMSTFQEPMASQLTRDALLAHALKLYENPGPGGRAPRGLTTQLLTPGTSQPELVDPAQTYSAELLPLLTTLRALHPTHIPTLLLLACVQYAVKDYEGSLKTNNEILTLDANIVEAMSNIATTLRTMGNLRDAEQWWVHAIRLRPSYWDAIDNLIGALCNLPRPTDINILVDADQPRYLQALAACEFVLRQLVPGPTILSSLSTGLIRIGEVHRLQNLLYTSGNLKFILAASHGHNTTFDKEVSGLHDQFAAVELVLNGRAHNDPELSRVHLTTHDLLLGLTVSALQTTGNLPYIPELQAREGCSNPDLLYRIHHSHHIISNALTSNNVLPIVLLKPENISAMMTLLFSSTKGLLRCDEAGNLNIDAIPPVLPSGSTNTSRMTATVLLTIAKHIQEVARQGSIIPHVPSPGEGALSIRASPSVALLLYYCALALYPSASICNNLGILLSTLTGVHIISTTQPPIIGAAVPSEAEVLTGPILARMYYHQGLILDPNHLQLLTNMGSLLKDEGKLDEAIQMYSRALEIKPNFDVALANIANATKDAGRITESIEYYKRAVLANPYFPESIVGLANALGSICDWQGRGGLSLEIYLNATGSIVVRRGDEIESRAPGFLDKLIEICDSQIINGYYASSGIIASDRTLEQWMETIEACLGSLSPARRGRWEKYLKRYYGAFDRAEKQVYEAGSVVRLVEMLSRILQRRWYMDMYKSGPHSSKGKSREVDVTNCKYYRPRLPAAMVAPLALSILPFHTFTLPLSTRRIRIISHRSAIRTSYLALSQDWLPRHVYQPPSPPIGGSLKVGYISSDFNNHPLGHLMQSVFRFHDPGQFEIYCYATTAPDGSSYRSKIEASAHNFLDVTSWQTQAIVERIQSDGIHILINLNGYTKGARNDIFVVRPAPIIISLMGFAGTMASGAPACTPSKLSIDGSLLGWSDYILTDLQACPILGSAMEIWRARRKGGEEVSRMQDSFRELSLEHDFDINPDPESTSEDWITEKFIQHTCFVTDHKQAFREDDRENAAALQGCSSTPDLIWKFEELYKIDPVVFDAWLRILARTSKSILWLLRFPAVAEKNILRCAELWAGPEIASRIRFTDVVTKELHIQRCRVADLFLDTIECNAHTVATDVLWGGTPIITWPRYEHKMCSRIAASIANATGYGRHMIVSSLKSYEDRAVDLAKSVSFVAASDGHGGWYKQCRGALSDLRRSLYLNRDNLPLFDTARWTRNVERAYAEAWRRWEAGTEFEDSEEWFASSGEEKETSCIRVKEE
ncbi:Glycosyltransferase family 41 protein [Ceratobasidium theobromae]|uniref:protein O-GlcNAc transferase n=1 Tax=Ceratobasidium theobromae TaxID=1582974 RepID=A0A5N5QRF0_9AGAM|nr:Glycosyltransferase family 41 protein [Ceratobasidium theobromae]